VVALAGRARLLNLLHGSYGVGTALAPLVVTAAVLAGQWRAAYWFLAAAEAVLLLAWCFAPSLPLKPGTGRAAGPKALPSHGPHGGRGAPAGRRERARFAAFCALGLAVFMVYVGLEVGAGQWGPSFERGLLHLGATATGLFTFGYWGALTLGRFALAAPRRPLPPSGVALCVVALVGSAVVWWRPSAVAALGGLVLVGGACAGVFPALVALTPARVGEDLARHVIGWQVGAAGIGGSAISAAFGAAFEHFGLRYFGPALVVVGALLVAGALALERAPAWEGR
jgi:fucose permease